MDRVTRPELRLDRHAWHPVIRAIQHGQQHFPGHQPAGIAIIEHPSHPDLRRDALLDIKRNDREWGRIEEITLTNVVVRIWDQRRLIVPITYFIDNPFQNWTRTSAEILGTVFIYSDYTVPIEATRDQLGKILESSSLRDHRA